MSFNTKVVGATALVMAAAAVLVLFFRTSDEQAVETLLRETAAAAEERDADTVVGVLSVEFDSPRGDYAWAERYVRERLKNPVGQIEVLSVVVQVSGDEATAAIRLRGYILKNELWRTALSLRLRRIDGEWKITSAEEAAGM